MIELLSLVYSLNGYHAVQTQHTTTAPRGPRAATVGEADPEVELLSRVGVDMVLPFEVTAPV